ncbi:hypothetical protein ATEIFO6365_0003012600 [Aspergillus terreus]|uniref:Uncharacterized protein n=1 Tax=Aspergillus terreus TaxID=33178 RepID=A0A5M3YQU0_ASPTE|nr:hypothetical protein ATETN484_0003006500 [Aspergillus terreus]GFF14073.1 hypothetical protein ATEIFO6365_0003012600 [Aspergillus terreus]
MGCLSHFKAMLRMCAPPQQRPEVGLTFEKDFISPVFDPDCLSLSQPVDLQPGLYCPSTVSLPPHQELANFDCPQMFHWFPADRRDPKAVSAMRSKKATPGDTMSEDHGDWSEPFASHDSDETKLPLYGLRSHFSLQSHESPEFQIKEDIHHAPIPNDTPLSLAEPVPKPMGLYMLNHTLTPFAGYKNEPASRTPLATPGVPQEEHHVENAHALHPAPTSNPIDAGALYQRSAEESSVATADSDFTSIGSTCGPATPLPWPSFGAQTAWDMPPGTNSQTDPVWLTSHPAGVTPAYGSSSASLAPFPAVPDTLHGLPDLTVENPRFITPAVSMDLYRPEYAPADKNPPMEKQGVSSFHVSADTYPYCESPWRLNQYIVPSAPMERELFQAERSGKAPWHRDTKNAFLIECKRRGLSYKDIKRIGGFKEAESTLRGRFRTLTKSKEQRVRKPQWHENDIKLLCDAVRAYSESDNSDMSYASWCRPRAVTQPPKVSWKKVAQYIWTHGGSYHFGNATYPI